MATCRNEGTYSVIIRIVIPSQSRSTFHRNDEESAFRFFGVRLVVGVVEGRSALRIPARHGEPELDAALHSHLEGDAACCVVRCLALRPCLMVRSLTLSSRGTFAFLKGMEATRLRFSPVTKAQTIAQPKNGRR